MDKQQTNKTIPVDVTPSFVDSVNQANDAIKLPTFKWTNSTCSNLQQMNEDCLLEIFSVKELDLIDLCSISETCTLFRRIVQRIVRSDIGITTTTDENLCDGYFDIEFRNNREKTINDVERILKNFGGNLLSLAIGDPHNFTDLRYKDDFLLNLISRYCKNGNLKSLDIRKVNIPYVPSVQLKPIFQQLRNLHLGYLSVSADATIFSKLDSLVALSISCVSNICAILKNTFPQLERFEYEKSAREQTPKLLSTFIARHKNLIGLRLDPGHGNGSKTILQVIDNNCAQLKDLRILNVESNLQPLQTLKSLRSLGLQGMSLEDLSVFSSLTELRELILHKCKLPDDSSQFSFCSQLTKLEMGSCGKSIDVVGIISRLTNLDTFKILFDFTLDENTFSRILSAVKGRPNILALKCKYDFTLKRFDGNQRVTMSGCWT